jgi:hypothetical protein
MLYIFNTENGVSSTQGVAHNGHVTSQNEVNNWRTGYYKPQKDLLSKVP